MDDHINKMWSVHTGERSSATKRSDTPTGAAAWVSWENTTLGEGKEPVTQDLMA